MSLSADSGFISESIKSKRAFSDSEKAQKRGKRGDSIALDWDTGRFVQPFVCFSCKNSVAGRFFSFSFEVKALLWGNMARFVGHGSGLRSYFKATIPEQ